MSARASRARRPTHSPVKRLTPECTPARYELNETGDIAGGAGRFANASGHVTVHGPFQNPLTAVSPPFQGPPFIAEMVGTLCGAV